MKTKSRLWFNSEQSIVKYFPDDYMFSMYRKTGYLQFEVRT